MSTDVFDNKRRASGEKDDWDPWDSITIYVPNPGRFSREQQKLMERLFEANENLAVLLEYTKSDNDKNLCVTVDAGALEDDSSELLHETEDRVRTLIQHIGESDQIILNARATTERHIDDQRQQYFDWGERTDLPTKPR